MIITCKNCGSDEFYFKKDGQVLVSQPRIKPTEDAAVNIGKQMGVNIKTKVNGEEKYPKLFFLFTCLKLTFLGKKDFGKSAVKMFTVLSVMFATKSFPLKSVVML